MARGEITGKKPGQTADEAKRLPGPPIADATAIEPTTKSEPDSHTKGKSTPIRGPPVPPAWYSVREFCLAHRLSISMYFKLKAQGCGPRETRSVLGGISPSKTPPSGERSSKRSAAELFDVTSQTQGGHHV